MLFFIFHRELILGFLKGRTVLLVTHSLSLALAHADNILCIDGSLHRLSYCAKPLDLFLSLQASYGQDGDIEAIVPEEEEVIAAAASSSSSSSFMKSVFLILKSIYQPQATPTDIQLIQDNSHHVDVVEKEDSVEDILSTIIPSQQDSSRIVIGKGDNTFVARITVDEAPTSNRKLSFLQFTFYFKAAGGTIILILMIVISLMMSLTWFGQNYYLAQWMNAITNSDSSHEQNKLLYYYIYTVLFLVVVCAIRASVEIFSARRASEVSMSINTVKAVVCIIVLPHHDLVDDRIFMEHWYGLFYWLHSLGLMPPRLVVLSTASQKI